MHGQQNIKCYKYTFPWLMPVVVRSKSFAGPLLGSRVRISLKTWKFVSCVCCVLCR